jgi:hypothetical protein
MAGRPKTFHVWSRLLATRVEELLGVVVASFLDRSRAGDDLVGQVERQVVGLLVVAPCRDLARCPLADNAPVELGQWRELIDGDAVVEEGLD